MIEPFVEHGNLSAVLSEMGQLAVQVGAILDHFFPRLEPACFRHELTMRLVGAIGLTRSIRPDLRSTCVARVLGRPHPYPGIDVWANRPIGADVKHCKCMASFPSVPRQFRRRCRQHASISCVSQ